MNLETPDIIADAYEQWLEYHPALSSSYSPMLGFLRYGQRINRQKRLFQIVIIPAFQKDTVSYEIFEDKPAAHDKITTQEWVQQQEYYSEFNCVLLKSTFLNPGLTFNYQMTTISGAVLQEIFTQFEDIRIPVWFAKREAKSGLDGITYELAFDMTLQSVRYRWWVQPQQAPWQPMHDLVMELIPKLDALLASEAGNVTNGNR